MQERFEMFTVLIAKISKNIRRIKNEAMHNYGLRSYHVSCLYYLYVFSSLTATELCEKCEEDKATISRVLAYLEQNGYLEGESVNKRYNSSLVLTEKGKKIGEEIAYKIMDIFEKVGLSKNERNELYRMLSIINEGLEDINYD